MSTSSKAEFLRLRRHAAAFQAERRWREIHQPGQNTDGRGCPEGRGQSQATGDPEHQSGNTRLYRDIVSARTACDDYFEYLRLARTGGEWKIANVLWQNNV
jgi:hypothetical protein